MFPAKGLRKLDPKAGPLSYALGVMGMPGMTAYVGLLDLAPPKAGETVVVSAASGAVGPVVGQIAKIKGCRAVGIAGGPEKCDYVTRELGFDACVDHRDPEFAKKLHAACPNGIDVDFENVGGAVLQAIWPLMNEFGRVAVCGLIAHYNDTSLTPGPSWLYLLTRRLSVRGFIVSDHMARMGDFLRNDFGVAARRKNQVSRRRGGRTGECAGGAFWNVAREKLREDDCEGWEIRFTAG